MIEAAGLTKRFGEHLAIQDVTFRVENGEIMGFLGPNGAGKSTTMRILTGYLPPSAGTASIDGFDVLEHPMEVKRRVGYLPEQPPLYTELLVDEYLSYVADLKGVPARERKAAVGRAADRCGLSSVRRRLIANLSKGFRQRVGLAQALIHDPKVVVLDEPTSGLDPKQIQEVRALIREVAADKTVILSTHILQEVEALCDKVAIINKGRIVAVDSPESLSEKAGAAGRLRIRIARPPAEEAAFKAEVAKIDGVLSAEGVAPGDGHHFSVHVGAAPEIREKVSSLVVEKGWGLLEMRDEGTRLEEVFLQLTQSGGGSSAAETRPAAPAQQEESPATDEPAEEEGGAS
ncbi:MAG: ATP-binding cassette domain-containing protein [Chrysiogenetes bacterium]|nr:ATP-binding cassette domain-containing protein [Chrysiogenetes bacterium]